MHASHAFSFFSKSLIKVPRPRSQNNGWFVNVIRMPLSSTSKKIGENRSQFSGPSTAMHRSNPSQQPDQPRGTDEAEKPRLPRSHRREIKKLHIEEAAKRGETSLPSRSARTRSALLLKEEEEAKARAQEQQKLEASTSTVPSPAQEEIDDIEPEPEVSPQQEIFNVSRHIQQLLLANDITSALTTYSKLKTLTTPNEEMIRQMISGLCRNDRVAEAVELFEEYKQLHPEITNQLYGAVLLAVGMAGDLKKAMNYFEEAKSSSAAQAEAEAKLHPTDENMTVEIAASRRAAAEVWLYARMIKVLGRHKKLEQLLNLLEEVNFIGFPQNSLFCATVIEAFGNCGATNLAISLLEDLKKQRFPVDIHVYNALLEKLAVSNKEGVDQQADAIFLEMPSSGVRPDATSYAAVIRALGTNPANIARCIELFEKAQTALCLSGDVYDAMIMSYLIAQRVGDAVRLHEAMKPRYAASLPVLTALMNAAKKTENEKLYGRVFEEMKRRGLQKDMSAAELTRARLRALDAMKRREIKLILGK